MRRLFVINVYSLLSRFHTNLEMDTIRSGSTEHCHAPKPDLVPVLELKNKTKTRAVETEESPSTILHSTIRSFPLDTASQLPQNETLEEHWSTTSSTSSEFK